MDSIIKIKLSLYGVISAISYIYLIMQTKPGISVPIFFLLQFISIYYIIKNRGDIKNKKGILIIIPIFILSLNYLISANNMFRSLNYIAILILYSIMAIIMRNELSFHKANFNFIFKIIYNIFLPFINFSVPYKWYSRSHKNDVIDNLKIKRILLGILISLPCVIFLIIVLSSADMIFSKKVISISEWFNRLFEFEFIYKIIIGTFTGLYLFGLLYSVFPFENNKIQIENNKAAEFLRSQYNIKGDIIVINILLFSILAVYTLFMVIQFKYLFAGANLPYGLTYSQYARRGFFELIFLSILNVGLILIVSYLLRSQIYWDKSKWSIISKSFLIYLCLLTVVLLISSFYRMMLYDEEYGFTRLRIIVYLFLIFEFFGLLGTLKFTINPNFNIIALYMSIGLIYYLTLNVIQIDYIIAKRNVDMYFEGKTQSIDVDYLMTLSADATPQIMRLFNSDEVDIIAKYKTEKYIDNFNNYYANMKPKWQSYNLSIEKANKLINGN